MCRYQQQGCGCGERGAECCCGWVGGTAAVFSGPPRRGAVRTGLCRLLAQLPTALPAFLLPLSSASLGQLLKGLISYLQKSAGVFSGFRVNRNDNCSRFTSPHNLALAQKVHWFLVFLSLVPVGRLQGSFSRSLLSSCPLELSRFPATQHELVLSAFGSAVW